MLNPVQILYIFDKNMANTTHFVINSVNTNIKEDSKNKLTVTLYQSMLNLKFNYLGFRQLRDKFISLCKECNYKFIPDIIAAN